MKSSYIESESHHTADTDEHAECWFDEMALEKPSLAAELALSGIVSGSTYSACIADSEVLPEKVLQDVEEFRFARMLRSINRDDPFQVVRIAPSWLLHLSITALQLTTRCKNVLEEKEIQLVSDLLNYRSEEALRWKNFGRKSARDLSLGLQDAIKRGPAHCDMLIKDEQARSWFDEMSDERPSLVAELALRDIVSDSIYSTYLSNKEVPFDNIVEEVEAFRFARMLPAINRDDPFQVAKIAPSWLLPLPITALALTTRCKNVLEDKEIQRVSDLLNYRSEDALHWKNFGRKSTRDLSLGLQNAVKRGAQHFGVVVAFKKLTFAGPDCPQEDISNTTVEDFTRIAGSIPLKENLVLAEASLSDREAVVFRGRFMSYPRQTLGQIGYQLGVTRERVRQIEKRCLGILNEQHLFPKVLPLKIAGLLRDRTTPLYVDTLQDEDSWFAGFSNEPGKLGTLIRAFSEWSTFDVGGRIIVSRIEEIDLEDLKRRALESLREASPMVLKRSDVATILGELATNAGAPELGSVLLTALEYQLHFTLPTNEGQPLLSGVGLGVKHTVMALLHEAEEPLHYREVTRRCSARLGRDVEERRVHSVLITDHAQYYGRGVYGTIKHFPFKQDLCDEVRSELENIILSGPAGRQWHAAELLDLLSDRLPDLPEAVDKYIVNIILEASPQLESLGRFVWVGVVRASDTSERIELRDLCSEILMRVGHPMRAESIRSEISKQRGTGDFFLINATSEVARVRPGVWGLVNRDFFATEVERCQMLDALYAVLTARNEGLHESELIDALLSFGWRVPGELTDYMVMSLAQTDERFNLHRGGIMALSEWGEPRRLTVRQAFEQVLRQMETSYAMLDIIRWVQQTVGRTVEKHELYALFNQYDVIYESATATYRKATRDEISAEARDEFSEDSVEALYRALIPTLPSTV